MRTILPLSVFLVLAIAGCIGQNCPDTVQPVCGSDDVTYPNACLAQQAGVQVKGNGTCEELSCTDTDGGKDIFTAGSASDSATTIADKCEDALQVDEAYCSDGKAVSEIFPCPGGYGCTNGACVKMPCQDSDGGKVKDVRGTTTSPGKTFTDECASNDAVKEYFCSGNDISSENMQCGTGMQCVSGACTEAPCTDSDGGKNATVRGNTTKGKDSYLDSCFGAQAVKEYYCDANSVQYETIQCQSGFSCSDGRCARDVCVDSDNGKDQYTKGNTTYGTTVDTDNCYSSTTVMEYFCASDTSIQMEKINCGSGKECFDGRCRQVECTKNVTAINDTPRRRQLASFDDTDTLVLHSGEAVEINGGYFLKLQTLSGNHTTFRLYDDYEAFKSGSSLCSKTIDAGDSENDICDENTGTIEVLSVNNSESTAEISIEGYYAVEYYILEGTVTDWTDNPICPDDETEYDSFTAEFYPHLDTAPSGLDLEGKNFNLFDSTAKVKEVSDNSITFELDGEDYTVEDGDSFEYAGVDYDIGLSFNADGLTKLYAEPA